MKLVYGKSSSDRNVRDAKMCAYTCMDRHCT